MLRNATNTTEENQLSEAELYREALASLYDEKFTALGSTRLRAATQTYRDAQKQITEHIDILFALCKDVNCDFTDIQKQAHSIFESAALLEEGPSSEDPEVALTSHAIHLFKATEIVNRYKEAFEKDQGALRRQGAALRSAMDECSKIEGDLETREEKLQRIEERYERIEAELLEQGDEPEDSKELAKLRTDKDSVSVRIARLEETYPDIRKNRAALVKAFEAELETAINTLSKLYTETSNCLEVIDGEEINEDLAKRDEEAGEYLKSEDGQKEVEERYFQKIKSRLVDHEVKIVLKGSQRFFAMSIVLATHREGSYQDYEQMALENKKTLPHNVHKAFIRSLRHRIMRRHSYGRGKRFAFFTSDECRRDAEVAQKAADTLRKHPDALNSDAKGHKNVIAGIIYLSEKAVFLRKTAKERRQEK